MTEALREYVEMLFTYAPKTQAAYELKEEILANAIERYQDLVANGMPEGDAYQNVVDSIGDVSDLFGTVEGQQEYYYDPDPWRKKSALIVTIAIGLYIFAAVALVLIRSADGIAIALAISIIPTCMLVYRACAYPRYQKQQESVVEDFKSWRNDKKRRKKVRGAISTINWMVCLILYFIISMTTGAWYITWVLFLVSTCVEGVVNLIFGIKELR